MIAYPRNPTWNPRLAPSGCKGYWLANAGGGTVIRDLSPSRLHAAFTGTPAWGPGPAGPRLGGFSTSDSARVDTPTPILGSSTYPFWIAVLCSSTGSSAGYIFSQSAASSTHRVGIYLNSGVADPQIFIGGSSPDVFLIGSTVGNNGPMPANDGTPCVIMEVSRSATDHEMFVNGRSRATASTDPGTISCDRILFGQALYNGSPNASTVGSILAALMGNGGVPDPRALAADLLSGRFAAVRPRPATTGAKVPAPPQYLNLAAGGQFLSLQI